MRRWKMAAKERRDRKEPPNQAGDRVFGRSDARITKAPTASTLLQR